jgi:hypothetical protein
MLRMTNAATAQAVEILRERLREFVESTDGSRQTVAMSGRDSDSISLNTLDSRGKRKPSVEEEDDDI